MTSQEYALKLKDPRWQKKRLEVFERANFTCQDCGATDKSLHAHHCWYNANETDPWDYPDECFRCLCDECHDERHMIERLVVMLFRQLLARHTRWHLHDLHGEFYDALKKKISLTIAPQLPAISWPEWALEAAK